MMQPMSEELLAVMQEEDQNSLEHYGVKGQKWGQRNYQNPDGTYTDLGKERRRVKFIREEKAKKESDANAHQNGIEESIDTDIKIGGKAYKDMTRKELRAAKKRARHNEAERRARREFNRDKKQALEDGDIAFISKNISKFTNDELDQALIRYNKMQNLKNVENANKKNSGYYADKVIEWLNRGAKASSAIANISNNFNDMSKKSAEKRKAWTDYEYFKDPNLKPKTEKEKMDIEKQRLELDWLKNPKSKPMTEKEELDLKWLKDPKSKPKTRKEEIEAEKAEKELEWFYDPDKKPKSEKEKMDLEKARQEYEWFLDPKKKPKSYMDEYNDLQKKEFARSQSEIANQNAAAARIKELEAEQKRREMDKDWQDYISRKSQAEKEKLEWEKAVREEETNAKKSSKYWFAGQPGKQSKLGSWFSKNDKDKVHKEMNQDFDPDDKGVNIITRKYLNKLKESPKDYFKENQVQTDQWKKDLKKHDAAVIDKWVKDMKKKYMKERKMDSKAALAKAEEYVDAWLDAYDEGNI